MQAKRPRMKIGIAVAIALTVLLRVVALSSDAYLRLSWSAALLTDEGFYLHNARNTVLFGHPVTDDWNNALLMPVLHFVQVAWFHLLGMGAVQARLLSVVCSLLVLGVFYLALRRAFGSAVAGISTLFLGLDHTHLLYNRMALMDTPALLPLCLALLCLILAFPSAESEPNGPALSVGWLIGCGLWLSVAYAVRGLTAVLLPVPLIALWRQGKVGRQGALWVLAGAGIGLGLYFLLWYLPNRQELLRINHYYLTQQLLPGSAKHLWQNIEHALLGDTRGMSPYLLRHTPVQTLLALLGLGAWLVLSRGWEARARACGDFLVGWLVIEWVLLSVINYSPSRYYVLFYPALAGLAGLGTIYWSEVGQLWVSHRGWCGLLGAWLGYHLVEALIYQGSPLRELLIYGGAVLSALGIWWLSARAGRWIGWQRSGNIIGVIIVLWAVINALWLGDWLGHLSYKQVQADAWLAANLPPGSVLLGDVAPGLCLNNHFVAVNVIPKLCNGHDPVERFAPAPRYIVILDGKWKEWWWVQHYPDLVKPERRLHLFPCLDYFPVGIYPVSKGSLPVNHA
jgi:4-amino-4-deoxy-L-arabinose transferase-like glycosyltransferase